MSNHESLVHLRSHAPENLLPGGGTGGDAGQLANAYGGRAGSAYELASQDSAPRDLAEAVDAQTYAAAETVQIAAADAESDRQLATRGHRMRDEQLMARNIERAQMVSFRRCRLSRCGMWRRSRTPRLA